MQLTFLRSNISFIAFVPADDLAPDLFVPGYPTSLSGDVGEKRVIYFAGGNASNNFVKQSTTFLLL